MLRILSLSILLLVALLTLSILLIRQQTFDASGVRTVLEIMEDCAPPCFMSIRPGVTTDDEARMLLSSHPWVTNLAVYRDTGGRVRNMVWDWNNEAAPQLDTSSIIEVVDSRVRSIAVRTNILIGDIWLVSGAPNTIAAGNIFLIADYPDKGFSFGSAVTCGTFWQGWVTLYIEAVPSVPPAELSDLATVRQKLCKRG